MGFTDLLNDARAGDPIASEHLFKLYHPLLVREAMIDGVFDQEVYNELCAELMSAAKQFCSPNVEARRGTTI